MVYNTCALITFSPTTYHTVSDPTFMCVRAGVSELYIGTYISWPTVIVLWYKQYIVYQPLVSIFVTALNSIPVPSFVLCGIIVSELDIDPYVCMGHGGRFVVFCAMVSEMFMNSTRRRRRR